MTRTPALLALDNGSTMVCRPVAGRPSSHRLAGGAPALRADRATGCSNQVGVYAPSRPREPCAAVPARTWLPVDVAVIPRRQSIPRSLFLSRGSVAKDGSQQLSSRLSSCHAAEAATTCAEAAWPDCSRLKAAPDYPSRRPRAAGAVGTLDGSGRFCSNRACVKPAEAAPFGAHGPGGVGTPQGAVLQRQRARRSRKRGRVADRPPARGLRNGHLRRGGLLRPGASALRAQAGRRRGAGRLRGGRRMRGPAVLAQLQAGPVYRGPAAHGGGAARGRALPRAMACELRRR